ncbi:MAG: hypothetical protein WBM02_10435 [bacterium]
MWLSKSDEVERCRLLELCRALDKELPVYSLVIQIVRVLFAISTEEQRAEIASPSDVIKAFHSKGLIPQKLLKEYPQPVNEEDSVESRLPALYFAASIYPQRAFQMTETVLSDRVRLFEENFSSLKRHYADALLDEQALIQLLPFLNQSIVLEEGITINQLLIDLSAAEFIAQNDPAYFKREKEERMNGAALYLLTSYPEMLCRIGKYWKQERNLLHFFRKYFISSPTYTTGEYQSSEGWPIWSRVSEKLAKIAPGAEAGNYQEIVHLEKRVWYTISNWTGIKNISEESRSLWEVQWDKLTSGFPYYSFRSSIKTWWQQCLENYRAKPHGEVLDSYPDQVYSSPVKHELNLEQLRWLREGYRLVRTTFFPRADTMRTDEEIDFAELNEKYRKVLDLIWCGRLESQLEEDLSPLKINAIAEAFPDLGLTTINNLSHRLKLRIWAYSLSRIKGLTNNQILKTKRASKKNLKNDTSKQVFLNEPAILTIASVARMMPLKFSLLFPFSAHCFFQSKVKPQRPDPWTFIRFVNEFWHWLPAFAIYSSSSPIQLMITQGNQIYRKFFDLVQKSALANLFITLKNTKTEAELGIFLIERNLNEESEIMIQILQECFGDELFKGFFSKDSVKIWRKILGKRSDYWIIPIWYFAFIERLGIDDVITRLKVEQQERKSVMDCFNAMKKLDCERKSACADKNKRKERLIS